MFPFRFKSQRGMSTSSGYAYRSARFPRLFRSNRSFTPSSADASQVGSLLGLGYFWPARTTVTGYLFFSTGGISLSAKPAIATGKEPTLRTGDVRIPFSIDFTPDLATTDSIASASVTVLSQPITAPSATPTDVTATILQGTPSISGKVVTALLGNANAVVDTAYTARFIVTLASGEKVQESITPITCDE